MAGGYYSLMPGMELVEGRLTRSRPVYLIENDRTGRLFMRSLRDAGLRGVRVRLLVDDLNTVGGDSMFRGLAEFPDVEVRLFNPFCCARQSVVSRFAASLGKFRRLNHRMHNKLFIADGAMAVIGGRNIADEYFAGARPATSWTWTSWSSAMSCQGSRRSSTNTGTAGRPTRSARSSANPRTSTRPAKLQSPRRRWGPDDVGEGTRARYDGSSTHRY